MNPAASWLVVLPGETPAARRAAAVLDTLPAPHVLAYADGLPLVVGSPAGQQLVTARVGPVHAALIGHHSVTERQLAAVLAQCRPGEEGQRLTRFPGSYHVAVSSPRGRMLIGDVAGLRPVFATRVEGFAVLGSHARILAAAAGSERIAPQRLALHLLGPAAPTALAYSAGLGASLYEAVLAVGPGHAAHVDQLGEPRAVPYWQAPDDDVPLRDGAHALRTALREAVAARSGGRIAVELSGGLDSTSLSFLAYERFGRSLTNLTREPADPGNDDHRWARVATSEQPGARHEFLPLADTPTQFDGIARPLTLDAPSPTALSPDRSAALWRRAADGGPCTLMAGKGGDELLCPPLSYLATAATRSRRTARRHLRGWAALHGWTRTEAQTAATHPGPYRLWLAQCLERPTGPGWEPGPWLPLWLTSQARSGIEEGLRQAATSASPQHARPHQHTTLAAVRAMATLCRLQADAAAPLGVTMAYPYADRAVIDAALAVRAEDRCGPFAPKPLLTAAMFGIAAPASMTRRTKSGYNTDTSRAVTRHHATLTALMTRDSALADHHLVEPEALRAAAADWKRADPTTDLLLHLTLAAEVWARTVENRTETIPGPALETPC